jgi:hypothetical protein
MFLVPKLGENKWRLVIDLRPMSKYSKDHKLAYETLKHLKNLTRAGDWMMSFDLADGYYTLGIRGEDIDFLTVNYRGMMFRLAGLPMDWKCRSYYFCRLTEVFNPSPTRTDAQPHRAHPPHIYEPTTHATETFPTLSVKLAMERRPLNPAHGRLLVFCR